MATFVLLAVVLAGSIGLVRDVLQNSRGRAVGSLGETFLEIQIEPVLSRVASAAVVKTSVWGCEWVMTRVVLQGAARVRI